MSRGQITSAIRGQQGFRERQRQHEIELATIGAGERPNRTPGPLFLRSRGIPTGDPAIDGSRPGIPPPGIASRANPRPGFRNPGFGNEPTGIGGGISNASRAGNFSASPSFATQGLLGNAPPRRRNPAGSDLSRFLQSR